MRKRRNNFDGNDHGLGASMHEIQTPSYSEISLEREENEATGFQLGANSIEWQEDFEIPVDQEPNPWITGVKESDLIPINPDLVAFIDEVKDPNQVLKLQSFCAKLNALPKHKWAKAIALCATTAEVAFVIPFLASIHTHKVNPDAWTKYISPYQEAQVETVLDIVESEWYKQ